ncbi:pectate lyase [Sphingobium chungbukense]|uniref:Pectate lyase n=1 Tax=Sphingobium chungbukense TaxID=56193 RepID=A0A0M3ATY4_9SPHN|nr:pectate lyase [Sphingobium chungbukense]KKW93657.1 pectate lyase [Sphingobium chungbukense]
MRRRLIGIILPVIMAGCSGAGSETRAQPVKGEAAFPGAVGYGAAAKGGRGGRIIAVDTLADGGQGSLRACIDASGPRVCVFRVSGVIRFTARPPVIANPYLTIAGQTAPGGGIVVTHAGGEEGRTPILIKNTHDIVIRHIRVRNDRVGTHRGSEDSFTIENSRQVIVDHVSASWARDELINGYGDNDWVTISNSIFAEGIPRHDKCALLASDPKGPQHLSFIGNICAHNGDRNPDLNFPPGSCAEVINNILYNGQSEFAEIWESFGGVPVSLIGNSFIAGKNTRPDTIGVARNVMGSKGIAKVYLADNRFDGDFVHVSPLMQEAKVDKPPCPATIAAEPADAAYETVLSDAGAFPRDPFDQRIARQVRERKGHIVKQPGLIDEPVPGTPYPDADGDGMDDRWEAQHGTDPRKADPWGDADGDGVANLDQFLDQRSRDLMDGKEG